MPARFDSLGITFQYPDDWPLDQEEAVAGNRSVTVYNPRGGGFWSVSLHPADADPYELAGTVFDAMREEYDSLEGEPVEEELEGTATSGFNMYFYCLDLTSTAILRILPTPEAFLAIFYQAEDGEFEQLKVVFEAITLSLIRGLRV